MSYANLSSTTIASGGGAQRVTIASTVGQGTTQSCKGCFVSCPATNTGPVRMNIDAAASATVGIELPEATNQVPFIPIDDLASLYFYSATNGDVIDLLYLKGG